MKIDLPGGIVYTLTQIDDISYVSFSVSGKTMLDTDGKAIGGFRP